MSIDPKYDSDSSNIKTPIFGGHIDWSRNSSSTHDSFKQLGFKADQDKPNLDLVLGDFPRALLAVGEVGTVGAKVYTEKGWLLVPRGITRYLSACLRHYFHYKEGEIYDKDTKLLHLAHSAWNSLAALELYLREHQNNMINNKEEDHSPIK